MPMSEAKKGLALLLDVAPEAIEIAIRGRCSGRFWPRWIGRFLCGRGGSYPHASTRRDLIRSMAASSPSPDSTRDMSVLIPASAGDVVVQSAGTQPRPPLAGACPTTHVAT